MKGKATDRKGMGMELALLVLFVVFACSTLLVSTALLGKDNVVRQETQLRQQLMADRLAEEILSGKTPDGTVFADYAAFAWNGAAWNAKFNGSGISAFPTVTENKVLLITDKTGAPLLTVAVNGGKITRWSHH